MKRRAFLASATACAAFSAGASRAETLEYTPGLVRERLAAGETVFVDFKADWCGTCRAQERVINALREANPDYDATITFVNVDWDQHKGSDLANELNIPRRSTLVVLKGDQELGRTVAGTSQEVIQDLMDTALRASQQS